MCQIFCSMSEICPVTSLFFFLKAVLWSTVWIVNNLVRKFPSAVICIFSTERPGMFPSYVLTNAALPSIFSRPFLLCISLNVTVSPELNLQSYCYSVISRGALKDSLGSIYYLYVETKKFSVPTICQLCDFGRIVSVLCISVYLSAKRG